MENPFGKEQDTQDRRVIWPILGAFVAVLFVLFYPIVWMSRPVDGRVTEKSSGEPVEGAVVVGIWDLANPFHPGSLGRPLAVFESTTDASGRFRLPGWGPRFWFSFGHVDVNAPQIFVLKRGYSPVNARHSTHLMGKAPFLIRTPHVDVELEARPESAVKYGERMNQLVRDIVGRHSHAPCKWERMAAAMKEIEYVWKDLTAAGVDAEIDLGPTIARCGM